MVRSECDVAPVQNTARRTEKHQIQSRIAKLLHCPVLVKKEELWQLSETRPQFQSLNKLFKKSRAFYPADPEPPAPASAPISALFFSEVAEQVPFYALKNALT